MNTAVQKNIQTGKEAMTGNNTDHNTEIRTEKGNAMAQLLDLSMMEQVVGGADYSYAYNIMGEMVSEYNNLLKSGMSETEARDSVKSEYWNSLLSICKKYPEQGITPEKQAQIIFKLTIGG